MNSVVLKSIESTGMRKAASNWCRDPARGSSRLKTAERAEVARNAAHTGVAASPVTTHQRVAEVVHRLRSGRRVHELAATTQGHDWAPATKIVSGTEDLLTNSQRQPTAQSPMRRRSVSTEHDQTPNGKQI